MVGFPFGSRWMQKIKIIAEIGINHWGDIDSAKKMILAAKKSGCDYAKLQTYITEKRVKKNSPIYDILKECELSFKDQEKLFKFSKDVGIELFSTPFDDESTDFLGNMGCEILKVASFDSINLKLLRKVAEKKKQIIISTGMTSEKELLDALTILKSSGKKTIILHCISSYPLEEKDSLLSNIQYLKSKFKNHQIGYSDHTAGIKIPILAAVAGAKYIEKHFTIDGIREGPDHPVSINTKKMKKMISEIRQTELILGEPYLGIRESEHGIVQYRRSSL